METIKLDYPVQFEGRTISEITLRRPKVADTRKARKDHKDPADQEIAMLATLSGLPPALFDELDMADYSKVQEKLEGFFGSSETTV